MRAMRIDVAGADDLDEVLPLMRAYCDFYEVAHGDEALTAYAEALIRACADRAREHGAAPLEWQTAKDNYRAQALYDRVGGERSEQWLDYTLRTGQAPPDA